MSRIVDTDIGRFRSVKNGEIAYWLFECPHCKEWLSLSTPQMEGKVSVYHENKIDGEYCGYHQTHEYAKELMLRIQVKIFMGQDPWHEDDDVIKAPQWALDQAKAIIDAEERE